MAENGQTFWTMINCNVAKVYGDVDDLINRIAAMQRKACLDERKFSIVRYDNACEYCYIKCDTTWTLYKQWIMRLKKLYPAMCDFKFDDEMDE